MKKASILIQRYSCALFSSAKKAACADKILLDLESILKTLESSPHKELFLSTRTPNTLKHSLWTSLISGLDANELTANFIYLLIKNSRISLIHKITASFHEAIMLENGILNVEFSSAVPVQPDFTKDLIQELSRLSGRKIKVTNRVDAGLIGGCTIKMGSEMFDASVKSKLKKLQSNLELQKINA